MVNDSIAAFYELGFERDRLFGEGEPRLDLPGDWVDQREVVAAEVRDWAAGRFVWIGRDFRVSWVDAEESRRIRDEVFSLGPPEH